MKKDQSTLLKAACAAARKSYSPYSKFPVGAAVLAEGGKVFTGCNVENASYGLTICAERVAIMKAVSEGCRKFKALAVVGGQDKPAAPCGACLQVLAEFCAPDFPIFLTPLNKPRQVEALSLKSLLPLTFRLPTAPCPLPPAH
jgi:cytidine deaminase